MSKVRKYIPIGSWNDEHKWPSESRLRYLVFNAEKHGFSDVVKRVGKSVLIDEENFFNWVEDQQVKKGD